MRRVILTVSGDVQGVSYRYFAKTEAQKLGLTGWARNEVDGTVGLVLEGDDQAVEDFIKWARTGSPMAEVEHVEVEEGKYTGEFDKFEVK